MNMNFCHYQNTAQFKIIKELNLLARNLTLMVLCDQSKSCKSSEPQVTHERKEWTKWDFKALRDLVELLSEKELLLQGQKDDQVETSKNNSGDSEV